MLQALTLIAVVAYAVVAHRQWSEMKKAAQAAHVSAEAAKSAAKTADASLKSSQQQFRLEQRPYVWPIPHAGNRDGVILIPVSKNDVGIDIVVDIRNSGRSPAVHMVATKSEIIFGPDARRKAIMYRSQYPRVAGGTLTPSDVHTVGSGLADVTPSEAAKIVAGEWDVFVVGGVRYDDVFNPRIPPYETTYCFHFLPKGLPFGDCSFRSTEMK